MVPRFTATPSKTLSKSAVVQVYPSACKGRCSWRVLEACCNTSCSVSSGVSYRMGWPPWDCLFAPSILPGESQPAHFICLAYHCVMRSNFGLLSLGITDPKGVAFNPDPSNPGTGTLYIVGTD